MDKNNSKDYGFFLQGSERAVLLIHGITGTPSEMRYIGKYLNKAGFSVLCNTLPRHCTTLAELKKLTWQEIAAACAEDLDKLNREYRQVFVAGLSMGALMGIHLAYQFPDKVSGIGALGSTLFYDGWATPWNKIFLPLWHIPLVRNSVNVREEWPYGLKDETLRAHIERFYKNAHIDALDEKVFLLGTPFFPLANLYQHHLFVKVIKKEICRVQAPIIIIHAKEDDMSSLKNARYVFDHIGSPKKSLIVLEDSYHMVTIDKEKERVGKELVSFFDTFAV